MAGLKSFLYGMAPILGMTGAALYERQRALISLGVLEAIPGRGPGSGVPFTPENVAVVLISVLAAETLSEIDETVAALCAATPRASHNERALRDKWHGKRKPTFRSELGRVLSRQPLAYDEEASLIVSIGVTRPWRGVISHGMPANADISRGSDVFDFISEGKSKRHGVFEPIQVTAEIGFQTLLKLQDLTCFSLAAEEGEDE